MEAASTRRYFCILSYYNLVESSNKKGGDDLELVSGSAEDEFSEAVAVVREQEILFGNRSLLSVFGPLVSFICSNNLTFSVCILSVHMLIGSVVKLASSYICLDLVQTDVY